MKPIALGNPLTKGHKVRAVIAAKRINSQNMLPRKPKISAHSIPKLPRPSAPLASQPVPLEFAPHAAFAAINPTLARIQSGIPLKEFEDFARKLAVNLEYLAQKIGMSSATLTRRRRTNASLNPEYGDRLVRFQRLFEQALRLFDGNEEHARNWLKCPERALAYQRPLDVAETEAGAREVENILGRLEYGDLT